jgi:hypothetical protein
MKTESEVAHKLKQVQFRHAKKEIIQLVSVNPDNCKHNRKLDLTGIGEVGFCFASGCPNQGKTCDFRFGNPAAKCSSYEAMLTAEEARNTAKEFFKNSSPGEIAAKYPDVAALIWALDDTRPDYSDPYEVLTVDGVTLWADSIENANRARASLEALQSKSLPPPPPEPEPALETPPEADSSLVELRETISSLEDRLVESLDSLREAVKPRPSSFKAFLISAWFLVSSVWKRP